MVASKIMDFFLCSKNKPGVAKARCKNKAQYKKFYRRGMRFVNKLSARCGILHDIIKKRSSSKSQQQNILLQIIPWKITY